MKNFDLEYKLEQFRKEHLTDLFDENGKKYTGVGISNSECETMLELINELEKEVEKNENIKISKCWIETSNEVYAVIFAKHRKQLKPHSSFTDITGNGYHFSSGKPEIMTEWGFEKSETPLLKIVQTKENEEQKDWDVEFFIYCS